MSRRRKPAPARAEPLTAHDRALLDLATRKLTMRVDGTVKEVTAEEAILAKQAQTALAGSVHAQNHILSRLAATREKEEALRREEIADWTRIRDGLRAMIDRAARNGEPEPDLPVHPDDIDIDPVEGVRLLGPVTPEEHARCRENILLRDAYLLQHAWECRCDRSPIVDMETDPRSVTLLAVQIVNMGLPRRFALSEIELCWRMSRLACRPKRELVKDVRAAWRKAGATVPRGYRMPANRRILNGFDMIAFMVRAMKARNWAPGSTEEVVAETAAEFGIKMPEPKRSY